MNQGPPISPPPHPLLIQGSCMSYLYETYVLYIQIYIYSNHPEVCDSSGETHGKPIEVQCGWTRGQRHHFTLTSSRQELPLLIQGSSWWSIWYKYDIFLNIYDHCGWWCKSIDINMEYIWYSWVIGQCIYQFEINTTSISHQYGKYMVSSSWSIWDKYHIYMVCVGHRTMHLSIWDQYNVYLTSICNIYGLCRS